MSWLTGHTTQTIRYYYCTYIPLLKAGVIVTITTTTTATTTATATTNTNTTPAAAAVC